MGILRMFRSAAFTGGVAALLLLAGCGGGGGGAGSSAPIAPGAAGKVNLAITDAPSDNWEQVSVVLRSASLIAAGPQAPVPVWTASSANPGAGLVNLVDLSSVASLLGTFQVAAGTYDTLRLTVDTDPATMTLVDDNGSTIPAADITVRGNGTIDVPLAPALVVAAGATATLQADFNLGDPLSISEATVNGVEQVTLDLQVRLRPLPPDPRNLQFARKLGQVTALAAPGFTITDPSGNLFIYQADGSTIYTDADAKAAGSLAAMTVGKYALVASNLDADGTLYARRVWYAASAATLPAWTPEGLVRSVTPASASFTLFSQGASAWAPRTVKVDANTVWTYRTSVAMGTGTVFLQDIWRGFRVDVQLDSTGATATAVNIQSARDEGYLGAVSATGITLGLPGLSLPPIAQPAVSGPATVPVPSVPNGPNNLAERTYAYFESAADPIDAFSWWYFGLPSSADASAADLLTVYTASRTALLPVMGAAELAWDTGSGAWEVSSLVLGPEQLRTSVITRAYTDSLAGYGTMGVSCLNPFNYFDTSAATPLTITLDYTGDLQTVVSSTTWSLAGGFSTTFPVPESSWASLLAPAATATASAVQIWVRPVIDGSTIDWHAYSVSVFSGPARPVMPVTTGPAITSFTADPPLIQAGASATLTGTFAGGTGVITPGNLAATSGAPVTVTPGATTTYTLTVTDAQGNAVTRTATVAVGATAAAPAILGFGALPPVIPLGATSSLLGVFANGTGVITPGPIPVTSMIPVPVTPAASTVYTLTVTGPGGQAVTRSTTITVLPAPPAAPAITSFLADPATIRPGGSATLTPIFTGGTGVIDPGRIPATTSGSPVTVQPAATTLYTLTVTNAAGQKSIRTALVTVAPATSTN